MQVKSTSVLIYVCAVMALSLGLNQEGLILLEVKLSLSAALNSWSSGDATPCGWAGVTCNIRGSVVAVTLPDASLSGPIPLDLCRLPSLSNLSLAYNYINGSLTTAISSCQNLIHLDLSQNLLVGPIPTTLADLPFLSYLDLSGNNFSGEIPAAFGKFKQLESLMLSLNLLNGTIPAALGNITTLKNLQLAYNPFLPGLIPANLGNLTNLEYLWLTGCQLVGPIPESFGRLIRLQNLDLAENGLSGPIPGQIMRLTRIVQIELYNNYLNGTLPAGWSNLTMLRRLDVSMNQLTGNILDELCELPLESLNLNRNQLEGIIPVNIARSPNLSTLKLFNNRLRGTLPSDLGKNSPLQILDVSFSNLSGEIPKHLCHNGALMYLLLINNAHSGSIPSELGKCSTLLRVRLRDNCLKGQVPPELWGLPKVFYLELSGNALSGNISSSIGAAKNLSILVISNNRFSGRIPNEIGLLDGLTEFAADSNSLDGEIPTAILNLRQLSRLDLSSNKISGEIPAEIKSLKLLNELNLANNHLTGHIPPELGDLPVLNNLDLSNNNFSGEIPASLQNLKLSELNLSQNMLSGDVPPLFLQEDYRDSFLGNPRLCFYNSSSCNRKAEETNQVFVWVLRSAFVITGLVFLMGIVWFLLRYRKLKQTAEEVAITKWTSFHKLEFSELEISCGLKEANMIGQGASGIVYKVILSNGEAVAVKQMHENFKNEKNHPSPSTGEFEVEVDTLGKIRHKNIIKLWCCFDLRNYKLLVYEYMPNGSLGDLLHGKKSGLLDWPTRFSIALGAAEGLSYLHYDCDPPIVHRDVKSNNLLLDKDFAAKISDFGVAKVVKTAGKGVESMSVIAGSCGYIAPEYAYTLRVNEKTDIYSFGIVILELVTRKLPTDPALGSQDLATWVSTTLDLEGLDHVIDPDLDSTFHEHISKVLDIGLICASKFPTSRPSMRQVVAMLRESGASIAVYSEHEGDTA